MTLKQFAEVLNGEIRFHEGDPSPADSLTEDYKRGFLAGLRQASWLAELKGRDGKE